MLPFLSLLFCAWLPCGEYNVSARGQIYCMHTDKKTASYYRLKDYCTMVTNITPIWPMMSDYHSESSCEDQRRGSEQSRARFRDTWPGKKACDLSQRLNTEQRGDST